MASEDLLKAQRKGAQILHNGAPVEYAPRYAHDRKPWIWRGGTQTVRYSPGQCQVYWPPGDACVDADGQEYPEHDYDEIECRRCGAESKDGV